MSGTLGPDGVTCSPVLGFPGSPCSPDGMQAGIVANAPSGPVCASLSPKTSGQPCLLPGTENFVALAGTWDPNTGVCVDPGLTASAVYTDCMNPPSGAFGKGTPIAFTADDCLAIASSQAYPPKGGGLKPGVSVADASQCASGKAIDVVLGGQAMHICFEGALPNSGSVGDPCDPGGGLKGTLQSPQGVIVCIATAGQPCDLGGGTMGTIDTNGNCATPSGPGLKPGDACVKNDGSSGVIDATGACVDQSTIPAPKEGDPCTTSAGFPGVIDADGACVFKQQGGGPPKEGDDCKTSAGFPGTVDAAGACVAKQDGGSNGNVPANESEASSGSGFKTLLVLGLIVAGGVYAAKKMKK